jgi:hypothetical protein
MTEDIKIEMYHVQKTYLEGWYSITDLKRIIQTAERIEEVNKELVKDSAPEFKTMDETASLLDATWSKVFKNRDIE